MLGLSSIITIVTAVCRAISFYLVTHAVRCTEKYAAEWERLPEQRGMTDFAPMSV
jgi:hypothetical protein